MNLLIERGAVTALAEMRTFGVLHECITPTGVWQAMRYSSLVTRMLSTLLPVVLTLSLLGAGQPVAWGQLSGGRLAALQERAQEEGWTFEIRSNPATWRSMDELCGLVPPAEPVSGPLLADPPPLRELPTRFDWRDSGGCPPVRDQGTCGSCWAFATIGALECGVAIKDNEEVDLAEQWLVSCNLDGYGCGGGWFAPGYLMSTEDACGESGAVLEADFPYQAANVACGCPYARAYTIDAWSYVSGSSTVPPVASIKQALLDHGPVAVAVYVDDAFRAYGGGVFNACSNGTVNHAVMLVGWDDSLGVWIMRNSWGSGWGESGYMRIEYDCSRIGYGACWADYPGNSAAQITATPTALDFGDVDAGTSADLTVTIKNVGTDPLEGSAGGLGAPYSIIGATDYNLAPGASTTVTVRFSPTLCGEFAGSLACTGGGGVNVDITGQGVGSGVPADQCQYAPLLIGDGTLTGNNATANTSAAASCGGGGTADVWWTFRPPFAGIATIDTVGSNFDTVLSVYDACDGTQLACNDDYDGNSTSRVDVGVFAATTYYLRVAGVAGQSGDVVVNISTSPNPLEMSGLITDAYGDSVGGVTLDGFATNVSTGAQGTFSTTVDYGFTGAITPLKTGWTFVPAARSYAEVTTDQDDVDFIAQPVTYTISGRIVDRDGNAVPGVVINGLPGAVVTNTSGRYAAKVPYGFSGTAAPSRFGYDFGPAQRVFDEVTNDVPERDFLATVQTGDLRVLLSPSGEPREHGLWSVDGGPWRSSGETALDLAVGVHMVSYSNVAGWETPADEPISISPDRVTTLERSYDSAGCVLTVAIDPVGGGSVSTSPASSAGGGYPVGTVVELTAVPAEGYRLDGWTSVDDYLDAAGTQATVVMDSDRYVGVKFVPIGVQGSGGVSVTPVVPSAATCGGGLLSMVALSAIGLVGLRSGWRRR